MKILKIIIPLIILLLAGCATNVRFIQTHENYELISKPDNARIILKQGRIERPHTVIGIIEAELGKKARRPQLNQLLIEKAREIGADGLMQVEYDVDRDVYWQAHHAVVGKGLNRHHVVHKERNVAVRKTASAIAVVFDR